MVFARKSPVFAKSFLLQCSQKLESAAGAGTKITHCGLASETRIILGQFKMVAMSRKMFDSGKARSVAKANIAPVRSNTQRGFAEHPVTRALC